MQRYENILIYARNINKYLQKSPPRQHFAVDKSLKQGIYAVLPNFRPQIAVYCIVAVLGDFLFKVSDLNDYKNIIQVYYLTLIEQIPSKQRTLSLLPEVEDWAETPQAHYFATTLFPNIDLCTLCGHNSGRWEKYVELRSRAVGIELTLAEDYFFNFLI